MSDSTDEHKVAMLEAALQELNITNAKLEAKNAEMVAVLMAITTTFEAAVRHAETKNSGGQQVSFHGDFAHVPPSATMRMKWWAKEFRKVLK